MPSTPWRWLLFCLLYDLNKIKKKWRKIYNHVWFNLITSKELHRFQHRISKLILLAPQVNSKVVSYLRQISLNSMKISSVSPLNRIVPWYRTVTKGQKSRIRKHCSAWLTNTVTLSLFITFWLSARFSGLEVLGNHLKLIPRSVKHINEVT